MFLELLAWNVNYPFLQKCKAFFFLKLDGSEDIQTEKGHRDQKPWDQKYFLKGKKLVTCHSLRDQAGVHINPPESELIRTN